MAATLPVGASRGRRVVRLTVRVLFGFGLAYLTLCAGTYLVMRRPPDVFGRIVAKTPAPLMAVLPVETLWTSARAGSLRVGDRAPDFTLPTLDRKSTVHLADLRGSRPVVLVFGSYT